MERDRLPLYVMNADGSGQRRLTHDPAEDLASAWSPDGRKLAFVRCGDRNWEIYVMNADGSEQRRLTGHPQNDRHPVWSSDGRTIAFSGRGGSYRKPNGEVYLINADGSGLRNLTRNAAWDSWPVWSPDGRRIAFLRGGSYRQPNSEIHVINADGSGQRRLTRNPDRPPPRAWPVGPEPWRARAIWHDGDPVWSPDGKKIAFVKRLGACLVARAEEIGRDVLVC